MVRKNAQFTQAGELRKRGFTYDEIAKVVGVSKSTVFNWFSRETWSQDVAHRNKDRAAKENKKRISLLNTARGNQHKKRYAEAERTAEVEYKHYKTNPLFIAGLATYASIGDPESKHLIRISSARKHAHNVFIAFCTEFLGVPREKIRFWLLLHSGVSPESCSRRWSKALKLPISQFHKYQISKLSTQSRIMSEGIGNTIIGGIIYRTKLIKWIDMCIKDLQN